MLFRIDDYLFHLLFARGDHPTLTLVAAALSGVGEGWSILATIPLAFSRRTRRFAGWLAGTLVVTAIVVFALKALFRRGRPFTVYTGLRRFLLDSPTDYSLPSGHAAGSFAFALFVTHVLLARRPRTPLAVVASAAFILVAAGIAVSRVVLGFHFPLDVVAGATLGSLLGSAAGRRFNRAGAAGSSAATAGEARPG